MSQSKDDPLIELLKAGGEAGGRILGGLMSSPWTAVPTALIVLSRIDKDGKLTLEFLANLSGFINALATAAGNAIAQALAAAGIGTTPGPLPPFTTTTTIPGPGGTTVVVGPSVPGGIGLLPEAPVTDEGKSLACYDSQWLATLDALGRVGIGVLVGAPSGLTGKTIGVRKRSNGQFCVVEFS